MKRMDRIMKSMVLLLFIYLFGVGKLSAEYNDVSELERDVQQGKIVVTQPEIYYPGVLCGKVMGVIDAPIDQVWMVLSDYNHFYQFLPRLPVTFIVDKKAVDEINQKLHWEREELEAVLDQYRLNEVMSDTVYFYNVLDMPFPVGDRWYLLEMVRFPAQYTVRWRMVLGNMVINDGMWELSPCSNNEFQTLAAYTTCSDSGIELPRFIVNMGLKKSLPDIIKGVRGRIEELYGEQEKNSK